MATDTSTAPIGHTVSAEKSIKGEWKAKAVTIDEEADHIVIVDTFGVQHSFLMASIKDLYFKPKRQNPTEQVLYIWKKQSSRGSDVEEVFAGVFDKDGDPQLKMKKMVMNFHLVR